MSRKGSEPAVTACLIVRDEEQNLPRCLSSLQGLVDEIVVVDTGSVDRTRAIAAQFGAKVGQFEWCDDFGAARNAALKLARGRWVLSIDADEWIPDERVKSFIRDRVSRDRSEAYVVRVVSPATRQTNLSTTRLFPRQGASWEFRIHEQVQHTRNVRRTTHPDFWFAHSGYDTATPEKGAKADRNLPMLDRILAESEPNSREYRHAFIYRCRSLRPPFGETEIADLESAIKGAFNFDELNHQLLTMKLYTFLIETNQFPRMLEINNRLMTTGAHGPLIYFALSIYAVEMGRFDEARLAFQKCLRERDMVNVRDRLAPMFTNLSKELFGL